MSLHRLLPHASAKAAKEKYDTLIYIITVKWGWSWDQLVNTPVPVILTVLKQWQKEQQAIKKQNKK